ncbi:ribonuclease VapC [Saccharopolyspora subtropica]|uniref:Ribonuclease VapC n=2 Tax=Saccharopolyspora thermophila TaxID=89367 RepID=A0A917K7Y4_9PSEU|nr:ribonuclease VapC [Saccharopolyspora subtropica]
MMNAADQHHEACARLLVSVPGPLLIPEPLITEITYMVATQGGPDAEVRFLEDTIDGPFDVVSMTTADRRRVAELVRTYASLPLGTADACVVALAERFGLHQVATVDRRHFSVVRPNHIPAFTLLP